MHRQCHGGKLRTGCSAEREFVETCESQHLRAYQADRDHTPQWGIIFNPWGRKSPPKLCPSRLTVGEGTAHEIAYRLKLRW